MANLGAIVPREIALSMESPCLLKLTIWGVTLALYKQRVVQHNVIPAYIFCFIKRCIGCFDLSFFSFLIITITYRNGEETKWDGVEVPPLEDNLKVFQDVKSTSEKEDKKGK